MNASTTSPFPLFGFDRLCVNGRRATPAQQLLVGCGGRMPLPKSTLLSVPRPQGCTVECVHGEVWITHDHEPHDTILSAGERHLCTSGTRMLVQALQASEVRIRSAAQESPRGWNNAIASFWTAAFA